MDIVTLIARRGGVIRSSEVIEHGHSAYRIARAVSDGRVLRPQRGWLALPGADSDLVGAATHGVLLSCVTQADRIGLWVPKRASEHHVAARHPHTRVVLPRCTVHWAKPLVPREPGRLEDPIENVLALVAVCQPREDALVMWESALNRKLVDALSLEQLPLGTRARALLADCTPFADSGLETIVRDRYSWLRMPVRVQVPLFGRRVDLLFGERLVVQIDGRTHVGAQLDRDNAHDAVLLHHGYEVIRVSYEQVVYRWEEVHALIIGAIARGRHLARAR